MRTTTCECGHDVDTHFLERVNVAAPGEPPRFENQRRRCLGWACDDAKGNPLCTHYRPDKDSR